MNIEKMVKDNLILKIRSGSQLYGTVIDGKSDEDFIGVCIPDEDFVLGTYQFEQYIERSNPESSGRRNTSADYDMTIYSLSKFIKLLEGANPTILEILFAPENCILVCKSFGQRLIENRDMFVTLKVKHTYCGYAYSQRMKMVYNDAKTGGRAEEMKKYGFDCKFASHLVRLLNFGIELLKEGHLTLPTSINHLLIDIRQYKYSFDDILGMYAKLSDQVEVAYISSSLPKHADKKKISDFQRSMYLDYWKERDYGKK